LNIPYLEDTQARIAHFLTSQFAKPAEATAAAAPGQAPILAPAVAEIVVPASTVAALPAPPALPVAE
jgi:hypothetical protein